MAKVSASKKTKGQKSGRTAPAAKKSRPKPAPESSRKTAVAKRRAPPKPARKLKAAASKAKAPKRSFRPAPKKGTVKAEAAKAAPQAPPPAPPAPPARLLLHTKSTSAALALLEKGIEYIYRKDYRKARAELNSLLESYPSEAEILARARSYLRICDREEALQKKQAITSDQLYGLGVLEHNKGNYDEAISYFLRSLERHPDADYIYYSLAASMALKGDLDGSLCNLKKAIELNEESRVYAKNDSDFSVLQTRKEFADLVGSGPTPSGDMR